MCHTIGTQSVQKVKRTTCQITTTTNAVPYEFCPTPHDWTKQMGSGSPLLPYNENQIKMKLLTSTDPHPSPPTRTHQSYGSVPELNVLLALHDLVSYELRVNENITFIRRPTGTSVQNTSPFYLPSFPPNFLTFLLPSFFSSFLPSPRAEVYLPPCPPRGHQFRHCRLEPGALRTLFLLMLGLALISYRCLMISGSTLD